MNLSKLFVFLVLVILSIVPGIRGHAAPLEGGVNPGRIREIAAMLTEDTFAFGPRIADREGWARLAATAPYGGVVLDAENALSRPVPEMTEELYLLFKKTGRRMPEYAAVRSARYELINRYTRAECLENKGRFIKPLEDILRSVCREKTWIYNFQDTNLDDYRGKVIRIDLGSADLAANLGSCLYLLGDHLSPETRLLVGAKLRERIYDPYRRAVDGTGVRQWWITAELNWNAVCHAGVVASALAVCPSREERAFYVAAAEKFSQDFLRGFENEGYCAEGLHYWNYGFGNYVLLCETVYQATGGAVDLYELKGAREAALYPVRMRLNGTAFPIYADCGLDAQPDRSMMGFLSRRYGLGLPDFDGVDLVTTAGGLSSSLAYSCPNSATSRPAAVGRPFFELRTLFERGGVLNARPQPGSACRMAVSLKGGNNNEPHNHNDLGTFVVVVGKESLVLDPGGEVYTARTFSADRYQSRLLNSYGHPVPMVAGKLQRAGAEAKAVVIAKKFTDQIDTYAMDLRLAYDVPELQRLERSFVYDRGATGRLTVTDTFEFSSARAFGTALITYGQWKQTAAGELVIEQNGEAVKITIDTGGLPYEINAEIIQEENRFKTKPTRLGINLVGPPTKGTVSVTITPR